MNRNKYIIYITIFAIILIICLPTTYTIIKKHNQKLTSVTHKRIEEAAKDCYYDFVCTNEKITLKELYEHGYLEKEGNPITKKYYDENMFVLKQENQFVFQEK